MSDDRDWRASAYLRRENWPEAIPEMGPKREYGPYPWGQKTHHDPHDLDDYPSHHADAASVGGKYAGDVCPYCGVPLKNDEEVLNQDGRRGTIWDLAHDNVAVPLYHPDCYHERRATIRRMENRSLDEWTEEQEDDGP